MTGTTSVVDAQEDEPSSTGKPTRVTWRFVLLVALIVGLVTAVMSGLTPSAATVADLAQRAGAFAPLVIVGGTALLLSAMVPRTVLAAAAGAVFGAAEGAVYVLAGALLGAVIAFGTGRVLGRDFVRSRTRGAAVDRLLQRRGLLSVLILRLLPIAPFGLVSYALGATGVRVWTYVLGTLLGIVPGTTLYAVLGANATAPTSPAFIASTAAAVALAAGGLLGARTVIRRASNADAEQQHHP
ncbi:TVP38/TMEM64 family protein [Actinoplanes sp. NPDC049316]|uniref:TVP38/TMEM64 family protein n=1 Tax=Actinoplanes sp. NPDC049316 TaxID=3154727 RepID=UPI00343164C9